MNGYLYFPHKSHIEQEILSYLCEHPEAQDTIDGIVQWWLLERKIKYQQTMVKDALSELVTKGFVLEYEKADSKKHYRINNSKRKEIEIFLRERSNWEC